MDDHSLSRDELLEELRALRRRLAALETAHVEQSHQQPAAESGGGGAPGYLRAEQRMAAQYAATRILSEAATLSEAASRLLASLCQILDWDVGTLWSAERELEVLRCLEAWHQSEEQLSGFASSCRELSFTSGSGLPGRVWSDGQPHWIPYIAGDPNFPRGELAARYGLQTAFAVPIRLGSEFLGVLEFFSREQRQPAAELIEMMALIGGHLGQFMERKWAEEALRESEERFAAFMRYLPGLAFIKNAQGRHLYVNEKHEMLFHWQPEMWRDQTDQDLFPPHIAAQFAENDRRVIEQQIVLQTIEVVPQDDGLHHYLVSKFPILDHHGRTVLLGGIGIDITERIRAEEQLQESEERFRQLAESIQGVFYMLDPREGRVIYVSPAYEKLWGRNAESLYLNPRAFVEDVHPDDQARVLKMLQRQEQGENTDEEYRIIRPDGSLRWIWDRGFPVKDRNGIVYRIAGIADDVTDRHRAEEAQRFLYRASVVLASSLDYQTTLANVARLAVPVLADWCLIDLLDDEGSLRRLIITHSQPAQAAIARLLQERFPPDPAAPYGPAEVMRSGEPELIFDISDELLKQVAQNEEHLEILRSIGMTSYMCVPLAARGRVLGAIMLVAAESRRRYSADDLALAQDLAARAATAVENARLYAEVQQALQSRDQFLSIVAHELKTPITALLSYGQLLQRRAEREGRVDEREQRALQMLTEQTRRLNRLIISLLDIARLQTGRLTIECRELDLVALVGRVVDEMQPTIERHRLDFVCQQQALLIEGDELRLEQVLQNLLQNAVKYSPNGGRITVTVARQEDMVAITVADEGIGIPADSLEHLFSRFYRASNVEDEQFGGMGLGLYVVREIVALHGGSVSVASVEGQGSTFSVLLPLRQAGGDRT